MKISKQRIREIIREELLNEQPPMPPKKKKPQPPEGGGEEDGPKPLKIDIPDTPFEPDVSQIKDRLKHILKTWEEKQYMSDKHRWQEYYRDIFKLVRHLEGDK